MDQFKPAQNINKLFEQAIQMHQVGKVYDAEALYMSVLRINASHIGAQTMLGTIYTQSNRSLEGIQLLQQSLKKDAKQFWAHNALGVGFLNTEQYENAFQSFKKAIKLKVDYIDAYFNLAKAQRALGNFHDAINTYSRCISLNPGYAPAFSNRGNIYLEDLNKYEMALLDYQEFIKLSPNSWYGFYNLANALMELKKYQEALDNFDMAIQLKPDYAEAYSNRGLVLNYFKRYDEALSDFSRANELKPDYIKAYLNCGVTYINLDSYEDALINFERAIKLKPDYAEAYFYRGVSYNKLKRYSDALESFEFAFKFKPDRDYLLGILMHTKMYLCDWVDFDQLLKELINKTQQHKKTSVPFSVIALIDDLDIQKKSAVIFSKETYPANNLSEKLNTCPKNNKIRLGYFSADFREHPVSYLTAELFELHNRDMFEVIAFSFGVNTNDNLRKRLEVAFDNFLDVRDKTDLEIVELARSMNIDIAIDLSGYTEDCRTGIFAMRVAPIQVNYLGYPGTMGAEYIDYIIADNTLIPKEKQGFYLEKIAYLPNSYMVCDTTIKLSDIAYSVEDFGLPKNAFIFCCFNAPYKITPATFESWMHIMNAVKDSILWLPHMNAVATNNLKMMAEESGVNGDRIIFASRMPSVSDHLKRIQLADLFLDTFTYNAHTTCADALRVGLPVITLMGDSFASRVASSLLNAVGLPELITISSSDYESLAIDIASNPIKLQEIKAKLNKNFNASSLNNTKLFARHIEAAYQEMYHNHKNGLQLSSIHIV